MHSVPHAKHAASRRSLLTARAVGNRAQATPSEERIWEVLRARKTGIEFRRQVPIRGRSIADFYAPKLHLIIEVDGAYHGGRRLADARRNQVLRRWGYEVLRIEAKQVMNDLGAVIGRIRAVMARLE